MVFGLKITRTCHQAKIATRFQTALVVLIAPKVCTVGFFNMMNPNLQSYLVFDHSRDNFQRQWWHDLQVRNIGTNTWVTADNQTVMERLEFSEPLHKPTEASQHEESMDDVQESHAGNGNANAHNL